MIFKERANGPTPNGGSYSEIYYRDDEGNPADSKRFILTRYELFLHSKTPTFTS